MFVPPMLRGRFALLALVALLGATALAALTAGSAQAATATTSRAKQERRVTRVCAVAARVKSKAAKKSCKAEKARLARVKKASKRASKRPARRTATPSKLASGSGTVATTDPEPIANVPATPARTAPPAPATPSVPAPSTVPTTAPVPATDHDPAASIGGPMRLYSASSPFNTPIASAPKVAANSAAMIGKSLLPYVNSANFANSDDWGIPIVQAKGSDPLRKIGVFDWGYGADVDQPAVRVPDGAAATKGSDHHLVVLDGDRELDMWVAEQQSDGSWMSGCRAVTAAQGNGIAGALAGNAAGFALAAGVIRPEEIKAGRIDHALVFTSPYVRNTFVAPAVHGDGAQADANAMPMGTRIQLDPAADISRLPKAQKLVAQALKDYGAFLVDSSGSLAIRGEASIGRASTGGPSDIWTPVGVTDTSMKSIPWNQMRVIAP
jgi:hypothetical protein